MPRSVIAYDKDLPEIPGRCSWEKPESFLEKHAEAPSGWRVNESGRRPSTLLLIRKLRAAVDHWRDEGYPGASEVTRRLFEYWFEEEHEVPGFAVPFRYHFCQREAVETLAYLYEIEKNRDAVKLLKSYAEVVRRDLVSNSLVFQETMDGKRQVRRWVPELDAEGVHDLPPKNLRRYAVKMATGSGKTWVMAMAMVWASFHRKRVKGSDLSANFLVVAPNVIVYQRLEKDFAAGRIFQELPLIPPEWKGAWGLKVILRGETLEPDPTGNLFLTNIHQLYEARDQEWTPQNAVDALLGRKPAKDLASRQRSMLERLKGLRDLVVLNDEAHHVHDEELAWHQSLIAVHQALPKGLALWMDFSATPKDQNGKYYPWAICDYPLAQAVEDRIVKAPIIVTKEDDPGQSAEDPENVTKETLVEKYGYWIQAAVQRWKAHQKVYKTLGKKPVLFIMAEKNAFADVLGRHLVETAVYGFKESEVQIIHTKTSGEVTEGDLDEARQLVRTVDEKGNKIKAIVSVMMLREGWDVRNVSVVLGLRPFTAQAEILPEQVIGRGLRLMTDIGPDTQTLEVLGTRKLLDVLRQQLEAEGVGVGTTKGDPPAPVSIYPVKERTAFDIAVPITKPCLTRSFARISDLDPLSLQAIYEQVELDERFRVTLRMEFAPTQTEVHQTPLMDGPIPLAEEIVAAVTDKVMKQARLTNVFAQLVPAVRRYLAERCFGKVVDLEGETVRSHLRRVDLQEGIAKYLARKIGELTVERRSLEFERADYKLSATKPFVWRRNLPPPCEAKHTIFNYVATYNDYERRFAQFLDGAPDVLRFASLGTTEQGESGSQFRVDYLKPSGAIGFYHPDWVTVQKAGKREINWIIETKGRVWEGTTAKDEAIMDWCRRISETTGETWRFTRVNEPDFNARQPKQLQDLIGKSGLFSRRV